MTRRHATVIILVWALLTLRDATPSLADDTDKLIGTWKLVSAVSEELATGQKTNLYEGAPIEFITYSADGRCYGAAARILHSIVADVNRWSAPCRS